MRVQTTALMSALSLALLLGACQPNNGATANTAADYAATPAPAVAALDPIDALLDGAWRSPENRARDAYRHPRETLQFFGVQPGQRLIEISPGGGWYTELLAPMQRGLGQYFGVVNDPAKSSTEGAMRYYSNQNQQLREKFAAQPDVYGEADLIEIDGAAPVLGESGSADVVLTFRNVHNWVQAGSEVAMFQAFFDVLKPGGVLGVVEHRADAGQPLEAVKNSGYLPEDYVIALATAAGFELAASSEINANALDDRDHPNGVWTLPPALRVPEGEDPATYQAIGESDRMTLKFVKPSPASDN